MKFLMINNTKRLALGTAQFGLDYGISNKNGQVKKSEIKKIIQIAKQYNINVIDTAAAYGNSEKLLGNISNSLNDFFIFTKLKSLPINSPNINKTIYQQVENSLAHLNMKNIEGLLIHDAGQLMKKEGKEIIDALNKLKKENKINKIGVSVYHPKELEFITKIIDLDLVQLPFNFVDRRFLKTGWIKKLKDLEIEIHTRSAFLQGLLLMNYKTIPRKFLQWKDIWEKWYRWLKFTNQTALEACIRYCLSLDEIDRVIVGVQTISQLVEIIEAVESNKSFDYPDFSINDEKLLIPYHWEKL